MSKTAQEREVLAYRVALLLVTIGDAAQVADAIRDQPKLGIPAGQIDAYIARARQIVADSGLVDIDNELGAMILRLRDLYQKSLGVQDVKTALATAKELAKFLDLYGHAKARYGHGPGRKTDKQPEPASPLEGIRLLKTA